jgi:hypothetical protein
MSKIRLPRFDKWSEIIDYSQVIAHLLSTVHRDRIQMKVKRAIAGDKCRFSAQVFNFATILAVLIPLPLLMIWIGASMFVYAANAHHPDERVAQYTRRSGYRFYGATGAMVIFGQPILSWLGGFKGTMAVWGILAVLLIPAAVWEIFKARREAWCDLVVEVPI